MYSISQNMSSGGAIIFSLIKNPSLNSIISLCGQGMPDEIETILSESPGKYG